LKPTPIKNLTLLILLTQEKSRCTGPNKESYEKVVPEELDNEIRKNFNAKFE